MPDTVSPATIFSARDKTTAQRWARWQPGTARVPGSTERLISVAAGRGGATLTATPELRPSASVARPASDWPARNGAVPASAGSASSVSRSTFPSRVSVPGRNVVPPTSSAAT